eukprot:TRINITY_DN12887_c0_g1_i1.p1 TRINITY_DN12887_c0_g1~~TRINITY_DN12887_c0_g1_i1.p1  ORF type:complete len:125 (-),score=25.52 TRINITY_DN12887_c0_g1_i1:287-661(-)
MDTKRKLFFKVGTSSPRAGIGGVISCPHNNSEKLFSFVAHFHPTESDEENQIINDKKNASHEHPELVINANELIIVYDDEKLYNDRSKYKKRILPIQNQKFQSLMDQPINCDTPNEFNNLFKTT